VITFQPKKQPRAQELTPEEKERNRELSRERIIVEHHIRGVKRSRIVHDNLEESQRQLCRSGDGTGLWIASLQGQSTPEDRRLSQDGKWEITAGNLRC
jgi:hypothetical protein